MRKTIAFLCALAVLLSAACGALAAGTTLRAFTPFADLDSAAQRYMDAITAWEAASGNVVEDYSGLTDESWMAQVKEKVAAGEADVLVLPMGTGLGARELVPVEEIMQAAPQLGLAAFPAMAEADGSVVLSPVRVSWEALYINTDVLAAHGLAVPATYEELLGVCGALSGAGVLPVANGLGDWAEIVLDCLALAGAAPEQFGSEASLSGAQQMLASMLALGAFGPDPVNATDMDTMQAFLAGDAAMRFDSDILAYEVPAERVDDVIVIPMPRRAGEESAVLPGMPGFGLGITRAAWQDAQRREAVLSFVGELMTGETRRALCAGVEGRLGESIAAMLRGASDCAGILYDTMDGDFDSWAESTLHMLMTK